jgi:hypothetical protein
MKIAETMKSPLIKGMNIYQDLRKKYWRSVLVGTLSVVLILLGINFYKNFLSLGIQIGESLVTLSNRVDFKKIMSHGPAMRYFPNSKPENFGPFLHEVGIYKFDKIDTGFMIESFDFTQKAPSSHIEKTFINTLPRALKRRAKAYVKPVLKLSEKYQVDPVWILSIMWTESHFKGHARSHVGAHGLMQIMPGTKSYLERLLKVKGIQLEARKSRLNIYDYFDFVPYGQKRIYKKKLENIELGVFYLKRLLSKFQSYKYATVAYNMGPGWTVRRLKKKRPVGVKNKYLK